MAHELVLCTDTQCYAEPEGPKWVKCGTCGGWHDEDDDFIELGADSGKKCSLCGEVNGANAGLQQNKEGGAIFCEQSCDLCSPDPNSPQAPEDVFVPLVATDTISRNDLLKVTRNGHQHKGSFVRALGPMSTSGQVTFIIMGDTRKLKYTGLARVTRRADGKRHSEDDLPADLPPFTNKSYGHTDQLTGKKWWKGLTIRGMPVAQGVAEPVAVAVAVPAPELAELVHHSV